LLLVLIFKGRKRMISFLEFIMQIDKKYVDAFKIFCNIKDGQVEKKQQEWKELFDIFLNKKTK